MTLVSRAVLSVTGFFRPFAQFTTPWEPVSSDHWIASLRSCLCSDGYYFQRTDACAVGDVSFHRADFRYYGTDLGPDPWLCGVW